jgi:hypothetical protein
MSRHRQHRIAVPQPTCRQRPPSTTSGPKVGPLEISHACRLRRRLADAGADGVLQTIWGVGYRLADPID